MGASVTDGRPTLTQLWFKTLCRYMGICYASPSLTRQCVRVTYISPMPGHCVLGWPTFKRHWGLVYYVHILVLTVSCLLAADTGPLSTQRAQSICVAFVQCRANVEYVGQTLYKCCRRVLCLLPWVSVSLTSSFHHHLNYIVKIHYT